MLDWGNLLGSGGHFFTFRSLAYRDMLQILSFQPLRGTLSTRVSINRNLKTLSTSVSWASCLSLQLKVRAVCTRVCLCNRTTHTEVQTLKSKPALHTAPQTLNHQLTNGSSNTRDQDTEYFISKIHEISHGPLPETTPSNSKP